MVYIRFFEEKYGHYMWYPSGFSGMEHITMSGMRYFNTYLVSHELGHSWFGDNVTCATWSDIWINEGFATYTQYLVLEYLYSKASADSQMNSYMNYVMSVPDGSVYIPEEELNSVGRIFSTRLSYRKGGTLVHMIRFEMDNDSLFFRTLYEFQEQFKDSLATGLDFKNVCEEVSGLDFTDFFNQWYFGEGFPTFKVTWSQNEDTISMQVEQTTSTTTTPLFKTPVEYKFTYSSGADTTIRLKQNQNDTTYKIVIPFEISEIEVDPNNWLLNQIDTVIQNKNLELKVYLQGSYNSETGLMDTELNPDFIPKDQPYNLPPWDYNGSESIAIVPENMVDWILIELRDTTDVNLANQESVISKQAAILLNNGEITFPDGNSYPHFSNTIVNDLFVVLYHRNHLGIISADPLVYNKGIYSYDYTTGFDKVLGGEDGYSLLDTDIFGMTSGDADGDGFIDDTDKIDHWETTSGNKDYFSADMNLDSEVNNKDKNDFWLPTNGSGTQIPD